MRTLLEYGLTNAIAATLMAMVVVSICYFIKRPAVRNVLWVLVLVRLLVPPLFSIHLPTFTNEPLLANADTNTNAGEPATTKPLAEPLPSFDWVELPAEPWPIVASDPSPVEEIASASVAATPTTTPPFAWLMLVGYALLGVWFTGTLVILGVTTRRVLRFHWALRDAVPAPESIVTQTRELAWAMGLRQAPEVLLVPGRVWPALWQPGWFSRRAKVILPTGLLPNLDPSQRAAVLAHELAHLRRGDPWIRWLELTVCALYWWYPLLKWVRRHLHASEEACCDMWVVAALAERRAYATALVETVAFLSGKIPHAPMLVSGAGPVHDLQRRVTMIMSAKWPAKLTKMGLAAVLGVGTIGLAFGPAMAQPPGVKESPKERPRDGERPKDGPRDGDRPKDGPKDGDPRPKDRPRDGDRPKDGPRDGDPRPKDRPRDGERPKDGPREGERPNPDEIAKARETVEKARKEFQAAMERMMDAEARLAKLEGRPARGFGGGGFFPGGAGGAPGFPGGGAGGPGFPGGQPGMGGGGPGPMGGGGGRPPELRELQQQLEEMRRSLEQLRQEMRRNNGERPGTRPEGRPDGRPGDRPPERDRERPSDGPPERKGDNQDR